MSNVFEDALIRALQAELESHIMRDDVDDLIGAIEAELDDLIYIQACEERQRENNQGL